MRNPMVVPCSDWEEKLTATHPDDLLPAEREALNRHVASCPVCATVLTEYQEMDALIRHSLTTKHPLKLPNDFAIGRKMKVETERPGNHPMNLERGSSLHEQCSEGRPQELTQSRENQNPFEAALSPRSIHIKSTRSTQSSHRRSSPASGGDTYVNSSHYSVRIYAQCLSQYTEVLSDELLGAEVLVEVQMGQVLLNLFELVIIEDVNLRFLPAAPMKQKRYSIQVNARCQSSFHALEPQVLERMELTVEDAISGILLELFGVVIVDEVSINSFTGREAGKNDTQFKSA